VEFHEAITALEDPLSKTYADPDHSFEERVSLQTDGRQSAAFLR
jgi:hypothetical protein